MFVARKSDNIGSDIQRNWSSWNFGAEGFEGTRSDLDDALAELSEEDENSIWISGFDIYARDLKNTRFGELYPGYWVVIDQVNAKDGLSCIDLEAETLEEAIEEALSDKACYWGDGSSFDASEAVLVYSKGDIHVFEIED